MFSVSLSEAAKVLEQGKLLLYPTETSYGLGALAGQGQALQDIVDIKQREASKGLILLVGSIEQASSLVAELSPLAKKLMEAFWPGPLTLLLPAKPGLNPLLTGGGDWIALRQSPHPQVQALLAQLPEALVSTSANPAGKASAFSLAQLEEYFGGQDLACLSGGDLKPGPPSSLVKVQGERLEWIREAKLTKEALAKSF